MLYFIHLFLHFTPDPEKTVPSVCLCVCLSVCLLSGRIPLVLVNTVVILSTIPLIHFQPNLSHRILGCRGVSSFQIGYTLIKWPISYHTFVFVRNIKTVIIMIFSSKHLEVNILEQRRGQSVAIVTGLYMYVEWFCFHFLSNKK